jgi:hypothetical protein
LEKTKGNSTFGSEPNGVPGQQYKQLRYFLRHFLGHFLSIAWDVPSISSNSWRLNPELMVCLMACLITCLMRVI